MDIDCIILMVPLCINYVKIERLAIEKYMDIIITIYKYVHIEHYLYYEILGQIYFNRKLYSRCNYNVNIVNILKLLFGNILHMAS